jgi:serine/threonine protein phosphatase PrpC
LINNSVSFFSFAGRKGENEDSSLILERKEFAVFAVADGMGGHKAGEIASKLCVNAVKEFFDNEFIDDFSQDTLTACFKAASTALFNYATTNPEKANLGTTLSLVILHGNLLYIAHVGDSRVYLLRNRGIRSLTKDQTEVQHLIDQKIINEIEAKRYKRKNVLLSVLDAKGRYTLDTSIIELNDCDRLVLMTDGSYGNISKAEIRDVSLASDNIQSFKDGVLSKISSREIKDDYTAIFYQH